MLSSAGCVKHENVITPVPQVQSWNRGYCYVSSAGLEEKIDAGFCAELNAWQKEEAYGLRITRDSIICTACTQTGLFYAQQSLEMLLAHYGGKLPCVEILDWPRFAYRGVMLDVSRHFYDADFVIRQLKLWARLKINRLHWHLTDGVGWRLQIDRYPELTADGESYTKEDVRRVLRVADSLHITVVPEIEMFGHSEEVQRVYPQLFCFGALEKSSEYCIGREETFGFLENVLDEVMELFPSQYIHIGGDEASKEHWKRCPACQKRMAAKGLATEDELQSYGIRRISEYVLSKGRRIIGWDEIMEGGLAEGAVVMSWRGEEGGREAAAMGHGVIMTPGKWCYINNCQDAPGSEPVSQGGYLPLNRVYGYDPAAGVGIFGEDGAQGTETAAGGVMGLQANLWTEYVATPEHMEYMLYPRVFAIAEVGWSNPQAKNYEAFRGRCLKLLENIHAEGYNSFDLEHEKGERDMSLAPVNHMARGCKVEYRSEYHPKYAGGGESALCDGQYGSWEFSDRWQGFLSRDADVVIDLGAVRTVRSVEADFGQWTTVEIWMPECVCFEFSDDGENFSGAGLDGYEGYGAVVMNDVPADEQLPTFKTFGWKGEVSARYIHVVGEIQKSGRGGWLFCDEIAVN